jgi:hypothetical protein
MRLKQRGAHRLVVVVKGGVRPIDIRGWGVIAKSRASKMRGMCNNQGRRLSSRLWSWPWVGN